AATVSDLLRRSGASPFGVTLVRGGVTSDYRLNGDLAYPRIIDDAAAWASSAKTVRPVIERQARMLIDAYPARDVMNDTAKQILARSILALAEAPPEVGPALVTAVAVVVDGEARRALAARPEVADVIPAALIRKRVATAPPLGIPASVALPDVKPLELHRRLTVIAGRSVPESAVEGRWRMTGGDATSFGQQVFVLELKNGRATATMPCARSEGPYGFAGQVLELTLPKPSFASCPKTQDYWYPAFLFDTDGVMTVRPAGNRLDLIANSGTFHFRREAR
ncbi:MAG TPA: hypothetical protein VF067_09160, partial [Sphingomicrobium sp.]